MEKQKSDYKSEGDLQAQCFRWFDKEYPERRGDLFLIYNNAPNEIVGSKLKAMGMRRGVADQQFLLLDGRSAWFEFKHKKNKQSDDQVRFEQRVTAKTHFYFKIDYLHEFQHWMKKLIEEGF